MSKCINIRFIKIKKVGVTPQGVPTTDISVGQSPSRKIKSKKKWYVKIIYSLAIAFK